MSFRRYTRELLQPPEGNVYIYIYIYIYINIKPAAPEGQDGEIRGSKRLSYTNARRRCQQSWRTLEKAGQRGPGGEWTDWAVAVWHHKGPQYRRTINRPWGLLLHP